MNQPEIEELWMCPECGWADQHAEGCSQDEEFEDDDLNDCNDWEFQP